MKAFQYSSFISILVELFYVWYNKSQRKGGAAMKDFLIYFFGKGETEEFANFTLAHFLPILIAAAMIFLIYRYRRSISQLNRESVFRYVLAFALIISEMSYYWRLVAIPALGPILWITCPSLCAAGLLCLPASCWWENPKTSSISAIFGHWPALLLR